MKEGLWPRRLNEHTLREKKRGESFVETLYVSWTQKWILGQFPSHSRDHKSTDIHKHFQLFALSASQRDFTWGLVVTVKNTEGCHPTPPPPTNPPGYEVALREAKHWQEACTDTSTNTAEHNQLQQVEAHRVSRGKEFGAQHKWSETDTPGHPHRIWICQPWSEPRATHRNSVGVFVADFGRLHTSVLCVREERGDHDCTKLVQSPVVCVQWHNSNGSRITMKG